MKTREGQHLTPEELLFLPLLELVVLNVAVAHALTSFSTKTGYGESVSSSNIMTGAVRLGYFHADEAPSVHRDAKIALSIQ
ncbi:hypothetical protein PF003_g1673 [Phytophthora fragariae]|nr:hypothetical protein PF003_g1673 [Phytophthora fragariae]